MSDVVTMAVAGFGAAFVDGALGMGFGVTSSSILIAGGVAPSAAATTVNIAKIASGLSGGVAHWRLGNVDWRLARRVAVPGIGGAVAGAALVTSIDADTLKPALAVLLFMLGVRLLVRFSRPIGTTPRPVHVGRHDRAAVGAIGVAGGVTNGLVGAWGPVVTPGLLARGYEPRLVVGSGNAAEVAVAAASVGSLFALSSSVLSWSSIMAMLIGAVIAAPLAAMTVRRIAAHTLGLAVAAMLLLTNLRELAKWADIGAPRWVAYGFVVVVVVGLLARAQRLSKSAARSAAAATLADQPA